MFTKLKKPCLFFCIVFLFVFSFAWAMMKEEKEGKEESKKTIVQEVPPDSLILLREKIKHKLGEKHKSLEIFQSQNNVLIKRELKNLMLTYVGSQDNDLSSISILATKLFGEYDQQPRRQLQQKATEYFAKIPTCKKINFEEKLGGDQLGNRVIVEYFNGQKIIYHAKTHRGGLKSQHSSSTYPVDLKELMAYKVLEYSGIGTETHFFYDDIKNFYIATKDAGYNDIEKAQKEFLTYDKVREKASVESLIKDPKIVNGFIKADVLSRLLLLSDVLNNGGNIGFSSDGTIKVIDFNPPITKEYQNPKMFEDWLSGNNQYNYSDKTVISILKKPAPIKISEACQTMKELQEFELFVSTAYKEILKITISLAIPETQLQDLKFYVDSIICNYKILSSKILDNV